MLMSRVVEWSIKNSGSSVQRPLSFESRRAWRKRPESGSTMPGLPGRLVAITLQNAVVPDPVGARDPALGRSGHPQLGGQPRGRSQARHDAGIRVEKGPEELVAAARGADQVQVFEHPRPGWPPDSPSQTAAACSIIGQTAATKSRSPVRR